MKVKGARAIRNRRGHPGAFETWAMVQIALQVMDRNEGTGMKAAAAVAVEAYRRAYDCGDVRTVTFDQKKVAAVKKGMQKLRRGEHLGGSFPLPRALFIEMVEAAEAILRK